MAGNHSLDEREQGPMRRKRTLYAGFWPITAAITGVVVIIAILVLALAPSSPALLNRSTFFYGYAAYIDSDVHFTMAADWNMGHTIHPFDVVMWINTSTENIHPGDIILYQEPSTGNVVAHRVIAVSEEGLQTQADNSEMPDSYVVPPSALMGKVIGVLYSR